MKEYAKRVDSDSAGNVSRSRAVYCARPDDNVTETIFLRIINNEFFLFQFCKSVGFSPIQNPAIQVRSFVEYSSTRNACIRIYGKRADVNKAAKAAELHNRVQQIPAWLPRSS